MNRGPGRRVVGLLAACLLAVLGLTACSGDEPSPKPTSSVQPAETSTPEITVTPPALLTGQPTAASAVAFVKYFWDAYNYAYASYDTSVLKDISQDSCKYCASTISDVNRLKKDQARVEGLGVSVVENVLPKDEIVDRAVVVVVVDQEPGATVKSDGTRTQLAGVKKAQVTFALAWTGGRWLTHGVLYDKQSGTKWSN